MLWPSPTITECHSCHWSAHHTYRISELPAELPAANQMIKFYKQCNHCEKKTDLLKLSYREMKKLEARNVIIIMDEI